MGASIETTDGSEGRGSEAERRVYAAMDRWDQERHDDDDRGSFGRLLFYVQEAFAGRDAPGGRAGARSDPILPHLMGPTLPE